MARYFFHSEDGACYPDESGTELHDLTEVKRHAAVYLAETLHEFPDKFMDTGSWKITVQDDEGLTLMTVEANVNLAAAMSGRSPSGARR